MIDLAGLWQGCDRSLAYSTVLKYSTFKKYIQLYCTIASAQVLLPVLVLVWALVLVLPAVPLLVQVLRASAPVLLLVLVLVGALALVLLAVLLLVPVPTQALVLGLTSLYDVLVSTVLTTLTLVGQSVRSVLPLLCILYDAPFRDCIC